MTTGGEKVTDGDRRPPPALPEPGVGKTAAATPGLCESGRTDVEKAKIGAFVR